MQRTPELGVAEGSAQRQNGTSESRKRPISEFTPNDNLNLNEEDSELSECGNQKRQRTKWVKKAANKPKQKSD